MGVKIAPDARRQFVNASGVPYSGAKLFYYAAGSTTKQNTYTTSAGGVANSNPVILDSAGRTPYGVWFTEGLTYKEVLAPSTDTDPPGSPIYTEDNISGINDTSVTVSQWEASQLTPTYVSTTSFTVPGDNTSNLHVGRRLQFAVTAGTVYGRISASVYGALTTVTVVMDAGQALDSGLSSVNWAILTATNPSLPKLSGTSWDAMGIVNTDSTQTITGAKTFSAATTLSGDVTITGSIQGATPLIFEGATADAFETSVAVTQPTADRTLTIPNADVDLTNVRAASTTLTGFSRYATNPETLAGVLTTGAITPFGFASGLSLAANGSYTWPGGFIIKFGTIAGSTNVPGTATVSGNFNTAFPTALLHVVGVVNHMDAIDDLFCMWKRSSSSLSQATFVVREITTGVQTSWDISYIAIGY